MANFYDALEDSPLAAFVVDDSFNPLYANAAAKAGFAPLMEEGVLAICVEQYLGRRKSDGVLRFKKEDGAFKGCCFTVLPLGDETLITVEADAQDIYGYDNATALTKQLRNSLSNIFAVLPMLTRTAGSEAGAAPYIEDLNLQSYKMLRTITNYSQLTKLVNGRSTQLVNVDLGEMLQTLCKTIAAVAEAKKIPLHFIPPPAVIIVAVDQNLFFNAFTNVLLNSMLFTRDGNEVTVKLLRTAGTAIITIADRGAGIKPEIQQRVFEPFFSSDPYNDGEPAPHAGVGLTFAKYAFEAMGGTVALTSEFGAGTTVSLTLPLKADTDDVSITQVDAVVLGRFSPVYIQMAELDVLPTAGSQFLSKEF